MSQVLHDTFQPTLAKNSQCRLDSTHIVTLYLRSLPFYHREELTGSSSLLEENAVRRIRP